MKVWTRRRDGHQFLGCQDYRRDSRGCRATEILAWRERPTERQWWNVHNPKRLAMNRVALLADLDDDMANLTPGGGRQPREPTHGPAQAARTATGPQTVPARSAKPTSSVPPAVWSDGDVLHETADADQETNVDVDYEQWERTQPPASAYVADKPSDVAFESVHGAADAEDDEEREDDEWSEEDEKEWWEAAEDSSGYCQVDEKLVDQPPRWWARARREPAMLGIRNGRQPQLDSTIASPEEPEIRDQKMGTPPRETRCSCLGSRGRSSRDRQSGRACDR